MAFHSPNISMAVKKVMRVMVQTNSSSNSRLDLIKFHVLVSYAVFYNNIFYSTAYSGTDQRKHQSFHLMTSSWQCFRVNPMYTSYDRLAHPHPPLIVCIFLEPNHHLPTTICQNKSPEWLGLSALLTALLYSLDWLELNLILKSTSIYITSLK